MFWWSEHLTPQALTYFLVKVRLNSLLTPSVLLKSVNPRRNVPRVLVSLSVSTRDRQVRVGLFLGYNHAQSSTFYLHYFSIRRFFCI